MCVAGSSPLTRGKPDHLRQLRWQSGLIPAHAGKTSRRARRRFRWWAHPRSRGENRGHHRPGRFDRGSSPLTRGKRVAGIVGCLRDRLIPAHAGKTSMISASASGAGAHPRSRGENMFIAPVPCSRTGSSPLTRGKRSGDPASGSVTGLIPAHAGKTASSKSHRPQTRAHPRSRGENLSTIPLRLASMGSSPLTRGKRCGQRVPVGYRGLIPAHAGKTRMRPRAAPGNAAHPRSRGENGKNAALEIRELGSSPLTRGKLHAVGGQLRCDGLIPAHAGKTRQ